MKRLLSIIFALAGILSLHAQGSLSPAQILAKAVSNISNSRGVEATFSVYNSGYSGKGVIKTQGNKYKVTLPDVEVWYNGKDMFTYNKRAAETTLVTPTPEEIAETNPLVYVANARKNYNVSFSTVKKQGKYVLELTPKVKGEEVKRVTLTLNNSTFSPEKIVVEPKRGNPITMEISSFKTGTNSSVSEFEYPKSKYPNVEIVDLR
ncbi:MAG: outer-membrane lipoprotein carrier protein LolA [Muribaculaceae bacterium]|nr:outer-membrane lipoprotein carrier protein LolA [Muribaculaceae bacterium]